MEPAEKNRNPHFSVSLLGLPAENDVFAEDENVNEIWIKPKSSPLPRRRSSSSDESSQPPLNLSRKVSFADAFGLDLVSVREYDKWDVGSCSLGAGAQDERAPLDEFLLLPLFELPSSPEQLKQKLYAQKVELESTEFPPGTNRMKGLIRVLNISYEKLVYIRMTLNNWESYYDILADYVADSYDGETDQFTFKIQLVPPYLKDGAKVEFAIRYETHHGIYWANNDHKNYVVLCHKKDDLNVNEKPQEELDDRNLKSCLKTSYSKEILDTSCDEGLMFLTSTEAQQENRKMILEMKVIPQWNSESILNENIEQKEVKSEQQLDTQIRPPLTNPRGQETNLTQLEGLRHNVREENEKNAAIITSESPVNQQKDLEEHINFASTSKYTENKVKQAEEFEWVGFPSASNRNTPDLKTQGHSRYISRTETTDSANVATSTNNIMTQSSELFAINGAHLQHEDNLPFSQKTNETTTSHVFDTLTKSEPEINRPLGNNPHSTSANDMQDNSGIIQDAIGRCGKLATNTSNPTDLVQNSTDSEDKSGEDNYLIGDASLISVSVSFPVSAVCTNTNPKFEPERISSSLHGSVPSEEIQVFSASINDPWGLSQCYTDAENLEAIKPEDFSKKPYSQNKEAESAQDQNPANRTDEMIPSMIQIPGNDSTGKDVADEEKEDKVGAIQTAEQSISVPSHMLADTMVKEAIEAALFEITGDEGRTFTFESQKAKALSDGAQLSKQKVTTVLNLTSKHGEPSKIHVTDEHNTKSGSQLGELITETSTMHVQTEKVAYNATQKNIEEEITPRVSLHTWTSPLLSEDAVHPDMANLVKVVPDLQEEAEKRLSHEITGTSEKIPENIFGFKNCEIKQMHTEAGRQMAINLTELPGEEGHYKEQGIENVKSVKVTHNCNISEIDYTRNYSVSDVKESLQLGKMDLEEEETSSIKNNLYGKTDEPVKFTQLRNVTVVPQLATETVHTPELAAGEEAAHGMSAECEKADKNSCEINNEIVVESGRETGDMFSESMGAHYFEKVGMFHDTQRLPTNRSTNQHAAKSKVSTRPGSTIYTLSETKGKKNRVCTSPQNSELSNNNKCLDPVRLISTPVKEDDGKETSTDVINDIHPNSKQLKSKECSDRAHKVEQVGEACDSDVDSIDSQLNSEPFANEIALKSTVWKVCYFVLFVVFLVTIYHYDFIGCFALYLFSLYWLYCEGEANGDSVKKD